MLTAHFTIKYQIREILWEISDNQGVIEYVPQST
jgi:hypothetical protein